MNIAKQETWEFPLETGNEVHIEIIRKNIKNMYLHIEPGGRVIVSAPARFADEKIRAFILEKADWICRQQQRLSGVVTNHSLQYVTGETIYFKGRPLRLQVIPDRTSSLSVGENCVMMCIPPNMTTKGKEAFFKSQMKWRLHRFISERLSYWENRMHLYSTGFNIRDMKSRWGSCNTLTGKLTFNLHLLEAAPSCIEYVVVHELAHLQCAAHDKAFWNLVGTYIPDYKTLRRRLNEQD